MEIGLLAKGCAKPCPEHLAADLFETELFQMRIVKLCIKQAETAINQPRNQVHEGDL